ncbi:O-acyltransferase WSD1-like [Cucurbita pepo subsp. pepo]|uniref:O-acyltransferase WSD1-like n=1 Tax=Cucurbita pepo subsp. pepo TaxID=3664 RepID=UPI000C9D8419|nr:O-acyltransferase WSD1-like [Cucurbita pepo subsp. pepo]
MEILEDSAAPMSPLSQYFNTSAMCVSVLGFIELEAPISASHAVSIGTHVLIPANPRFSSIMVKEKWFGERKWKMVEVNLEDHIYTPKFPVDLSPYEYDAYFDEYATNTATKPFNQSIPLWEIHVFNYPTSHAPCTLIFKVHHSIADGFCLMNTLLSFLKRADDPSLPLTFPSRKRSKQLEYAHDFGRLSHFPARLFLSLCNFISNFGYSIANTFTEDDPTPIKREGDSMQLVKPIAISTMTFSLDQIKQIKTKLNASVNDVITGIIFLGIRLYMQEHSPDSREANSSALILLNTRKAKAYKSVQEMVETDTDAPWGNRIAFLPMPIPKLMDSTLSTAPLEFVKEAKKNIMLQRSPLSGIVYCLVLKRFKKSLIVTIVSYMGDLRIVFGGEKCFIDLHKLKACVEDAFQRMLIEARLKN